MAKYLRTSGINAALEDLIRTTKEQLIIVSPYLQLSNQIRERLNDKLRDRVGVTFVYGKTELHNKEMEYLKGLSQVNILYKDNLHAKCYLNENSVIISSMNFYEYSQMNNFEMGVQFDKKDKHDKAIYEEVLDEIKHLINNSELKNGVMPRVGEGATPTSANKMKVFLHSSQSTPMRNGYCIRTGVEIPFNLERPLSYEAFKIWDMYGDANYPERFCHFSGEESYGETSVNRPIMNKNWKMAREVFGV